MAYWGLYIVRGKSHIYFQFRLFSWICECLYSGRVIPPYLYSIRKILDPDKSLSCDIDRPLIFTCVDFIELRFYHPVTALQGFVGNHSYIRPLLSSGVIEKYCVSLPGGGIGGHASSGKVTEPMKNRLPCLSAFDFRRFICIISR